MEPLFIIAKIIASPGNSTILAMRPVRHGPQGPCSKGAANIKLAFSIQL